MAKQKPRATYTEEDMTRAITDILENGISQRLASQKWGIPQTTLSSRLHGQTPIGDQEQPHQLLSKTQEARLVTWILRQESMGYAPSHSQLRECVVALLKQQGSNLKPGRHWITRFLERHPEIKTKRGKRQEANRFDAFTPNAVNWYFDIREHEYGWIKPENTVNIDEGGIMAGFGKEYTYYSCE